MILSLSLSAVADGPPLHLTTLFQLGYLTMSGLGKTGAAIIHVHPENFVQPLKPTGLEAVNRSDLNARPVLILIHALLLEAEKLVGGEVIQFYHPLSDQKEIGIQMGVTPIFPGVQRLIHEAFGKILFQQLAIGERGRDDVQLFDFTQTGNLPTLDVEDKNAGVTPSGKADRASWMATGTN